MSFTIATWSIPSSWYVSNTGIVNIFGAVEGGSTDTLNCGHLWFSLYLDNINANTNKADLFLKVNASNVTSSSLKAPTEFTVYFDNVTSSVNGTTYDGLRAGIYQSSTFKKTITISTAGSFTAKVSLHEDAAAAAAGVSIYEGTKTITLAQSIDTVSILGKSTTDFIKFPFAWRVGVSSPQAGVGSGGGGDGTGNAGNVQKLTSNFSVGTGKVTASDLYAAADYLPSPSITTQPKSVCVAAGAEARVTFTASGDGLTYAWYYKNAGDSTFTKTSSFTGNAYYVEMTSARAGRQIYCIVKNVHGRTVQTNTVTINMHSYTSVLTKSPTCVASGVRTYTCSNCSNSYTETVAATGQHTYSNSSDVVCNVCSQTTRSIAKITKQPVSACVTNGNTVSVAFTASGDGLTYQWYFKDAGDTSFSKSSITSNTYTTTMTDARAGRQIYCAVTDAYGNTVNTNTVTINKHSYTNACDTTCNNCGATRSTTHTWTPATCIAPKTCSVCGATEGDALGHSYQYEVIKTPTCSEAGNMSVICTTCGSNHFTSIPTLEHTWTDATCTTPKTCTVCGKREGDIGGLGHNSGSGSITKEPTCAETGIKTYLCTRCGVVTKTETIPKLTTHTYSSSSDTTCNVCGKVRRLATITQQTASVCVEASSDAVATITATGDGLTYQWYIKNPGATNFSKSTATNSSYRTTMTDDLSGLQLYCVVTDEYGSTATSNTITFTTHNYTSTVITAATCTTNGTRKYTCSNSGCGTTYTETIPATGHSYTSKVTKSPTCGTTGIRTYTCSGCGDTYTEVIAPTGEHTDTSVVTIEPTCEQTGEITYTCSSCTRSYTEAIPSLGHEYAQSVVFPSCTEDGYSRYLCIRCSHSYISDYVARLGHDYKEVTYPATCTNDGAVKRECSRCSDSHIEETIPATGHNYVDGVCTHCSEGARGAVAICNNGNFEFYYCYIANSSGEFEHYDPYVYDDGSWKKCGNI